MTRHTPLPLTKAPVDVQKFSHTTLPSSDIVLFGTGRTVNSCSLKLGHVKQQTCRSVGYFDVKMHVRKNRKQLHLNKE